MIRYNRAIAFLAVGVIGVMGLAACNKTEETVAPSPETSMSPTTAPSVSANTTDTTKSPEVTGLLEVVSTTKTAVEAGDFAKAKDEFARMEDYWRPIEDGVKEKASGTYDAIEANMDKVNENLDAAQPNKDEIMAALQSLDTDINSIPQ